MNINWPWINAASNQMKVIDYQNSKTLGQTPSQNSGGKKLKVGFEAQEIRYGCLQKMECRMNYPAYLHQPLKAIRSHFQNKKDSSHGKDLLHFHMCTLYSHF